MAALTLKDVGPIKAISIPCPESGGIVVLRGRNGAGKTTALDAAETLIRGKGQLSSRDGTARGEIEGFGARITVGRTTRRTGELECLSLEGRMALSELVDPGLKDQAAADGKRIKALVGLSGRRADPEAFAAILPDRAAWDALVKPETLQATDPVEMAARVKRDLEAAARREEDTAEKQSGAALGFRKAAEGIDLNGHSNPATLQDALEQAIAAESGIKARVGAAMEARQRAREAKERLAAEEARYTGPTVQQAHDAMEAAEEAMGQARAGVEEAERRLAAAKQIMDQARHAWERTVDAHKAAMQHQETVAACRDALAVSEGAEAPTTEEAVAASDAVSRARRALENGAAIRRARQQIEAAEEAEDLARAARDKAARLRDAARGTDDVLSQAVACPVLRVESGRLVTDTGRGVTLFAELSMGERWRIALDLAADQVGEGGIIVVPQEAYESLDFSNRQAIHEHAVERRVVVLTAEATDGALRAEVYGDNGRD